MAPRALRIVHFNDVYHIEPGERDPVGGAARFVSVLNEYRDQERYACQPELLILFSGDAFNPSIESTVTKGQHMVPILRDAIKVDVACCGNHDFDFGVDQMIYLCKQTKFPWLISNVFDGKKPLGGAAQTHILTSSNGIKIGVMGLIEKEWLDTINSLPPNLRFVEPSEMAKELAPTLRNQGAEMIVALNHMREPNDVRLANSVPEGLIDVILGGHDHYYNLQTVNGIPVLRSGSDFRQLTYIEATQESSFPKWEFTFKRRDITSEIPEDPTTKAVVSSLSDALQKKLSKPIGYSGVDLDARFATVRAEESNYGSLICDLMRFYYHTDVALMAGGTMRGDQIYPAGIIRLGDVISCFPFEDPCVVIRVTGKALWSALENSVSKLPAFEGRFSQVSGLRFGYNPTPPEGKRVRWVEVGGEPLDFEKRYSVATRGYMARGKDGFESLNEENEDVEVVIDEEHGVLISTIIRQYFLSLKVLSRWKRGLCVTKLFSGLKKDQLNAGVLSNSKSPRLSAATSVGTESTESSEDEARIVDVEATSPVQERRMSKEEELRLFELKKRVARKWELLAKIGKNIRENGSAEVGVEWCRSVRPRVEGRINIVTS